MTIYTGLPARFDSTNGPVTGTVISEPFWVNDPEFVHPCQHVAVRLDETCRGWLTPGYEREYGDHRRTLFLSTVIMSLSEVIHPDGKETP